MKFAEEEAVVSHITGEFVFLETQNKASCNNCSSKTGCGSVASIFSFRPRNKLKVINTLKLNEGDTVIVGMPSNKLLQATILMYLLPLLLLFIFAFIALLILGESASAIAGFLGLFLGLLMVNQYSKKTKIANQFEPKLIRKIINLEPV